MSSIFKNIFGLKLKKNRTREVLNSVLSEIKRRKVKASSSRVFAVEKSIAEWRQYIDQALSAPYYNKVELYNTYRNTLFDAHLEAQVDTRFTGTLAEEVIVLNGKQEDEPLSEFIQQPFFKDLMQAILDKITWGQSAVELLSDGQQLYTHSFEKDEFSPERKAIIPNPRQYTQTIPIDYKAFPSFLLFTDKRSHNIGKLSIASRYALYKQYSLSDWARHSERFGTPFLVAKTDITQESELDKYAKMLANFGNNGWAMLDENDELDMLQANNAGKPYEIYKEMLLYCDEQISKSIVGQTGTADQKAYVGAAEVQERVLNWYVEKDMRTVRDELNQPRVSEILQKLSGLNFVGKRFEFAYFHRQQYEGSKSLYDLHDITNPHYFVKKKTILSLSDEDSELEVKNLSLIDEFWKILKATAQKIHKERKIDIFEDLKKEFQELSDLTFKAFLKAVETGFNNAIIDNEPDLNMLENLRNNVYIFSQFKTYQELRQATDLLFEGKAKTQIKPFGKYLEDIRALNQTYNEHYLRAEYNHAIASSQQASIWADIWQDRDLFDLQYDAVNDERTRESHAALDGIVRPIEDAFWDIYFPPLGWGCRCTVRKIRKGDKKHSDVSKFTGSELQPMFRVNTAKQGVVFPEKHPYYKENEANRTFNKSKVLFSAGFVDENAGETLKIHPPLKSDGLNQEQAIEAIKNKQKESLYFFKNGKQIARFEGESNYVNPAEQQLLRMKDCTIIHNHPTSQSFSVEDMQAITRYDAKGLIVSSPEYLYRVVRPKAGWGDMLNNSTLEESISLTEDSINKSVQRGEISYTQKLENEMHEVWQLFFKLNNTYYERKKI